jgi:ketosteroid isomerase-like protein
MHLLQKLMARRQFLISAGAASSCALASKKLSGFEPNASPAAGTAAATDVTTTKKQNYDLVKRMITSQYWRPENIAMFSGDFGLELPNAPPGMPQVFNHVDYLEYADWMTQTVRSWQVKPEYEIYGSKDGNLFWVVRECSGDVHWAGKDGKFESRMVSRITTENGKIKHMRELSDPLSYLRAIGADVPTFHVKMDYEAIKKAKEEEAKKKPAAAAPLDKSPAACAKRMADNLDVYRKAIDYKLEPQMETLTDDCEWRVWFLPPEMKAAYFGDEKIGIDIWTDRSVIAYKYIPGAVVYETDDPTVYFTETGGTGISEWQGNNVRGRYRNRYVMFDKMENGALKRHHEYLNPINKFNSINKSIPTFPYYF